MSEPSLRPDAVIAVFLWAAVLTLAFVVAQITGNGTLFIIIAVLSFVALAIPYLYRKLRGAR